MATVRIDNDTLHVTLSTWHAVLAVHGSFAVPLTNVVGASTEKPPSFWSSLKLFGTGAAPFGPTAGTFLYHGETVFFDYSQRDDTVLTVDLAEGGYKHLFVHVDEPDTAYDAAERITAALAAAKTR